MPFSPIPEIIEELKAGRMVVLTDDEDRENEGDLVVLADRITPEQINFMVKEARGILCLSLGAEICDRLDLKLQSQGRAHSKFGTAASLEPARRARSTLPSVWPGRTRTPPRRARSG